MKVQKFSITIKLQFNSSTFSKQHLSNNLFNQKLQFRISMLTKRHQSLPRDNHLLRISSLNQKHLRRSSRARCRECPLSLQ